MLADKVEVRLSSLEARIQTLERKVYEQIFPELGKRTEDDYQQGYADGIEGAQDTVTDWYEPEPPEPED